MIVFWVLVGAAAGAYLGHILRNRVRVTFEVSLTGEARIASAELKERARTLWARRRVPLTLGAAIIAAAAIGSGSGGEPRSVTGFTWISDANPRGYRVWTIDRDGQWHEHYPDGHQAKFFDITSRDRVNGCDGYVTRQSATPDPLVFIPDVGCRNMTALFIWGQGSWAPLGTMTTISTRPPSESGPRG